MMFLKEFLVGFVFTLSVILVSALLIVTVKGLIMYDIRLWYILCGALICWGIGYAITY
jgi:hypothetical protein